MSSKLGQQQEQPKSAPDRAARASKPSDVKITPPAIFEQVRAFARAIGKPHVHDACTQPDNPLGADSFWTEQDDALSKVWDRDDVLYYCNPPYSRGQLESWVEHARIQDGSVLMLTPADFTTRWFKEMYTLCQSMSLLAKRVRFLEPRGHAPGYVEMRAGARFCCALTYFAKSGKRADKLAFGATLSGLSSQGLEGYRLI